MPKKKLFADKDKEKLKKDKERIKKEKEKLKKEKEKLNNLKISGKSPRGWYEINLRS